MCALEAGTTNICQHEWMCSDRHVKFGYKSSMIDKRLQWEGTVCMRARTKGFTARSKCFHTQREQRR